MSSASTGEMSCAGDYYPATIRASAASASAAALEAAACGTADRPGRQPLRHWRVLIPDRRLFRVELSRGGADGTSAHRPATKGGGGAAQACAVVRRAVLLPVSPIPKTRDGDPRQGGPALHCARLASMAVGPSGCGIARGVGPFYARRQPPYLETVYDELRNRFGAAGDFAQALSSPTGRIHLTCPCAERAQAEQQRLSSREGMPAGEDRVQRLLCGRWRHAPTPGPAADRAGRIEEGLRAAARSATNAPEPDQGTRLAEELNPRQRGAERPWLRKGLRLASGGLRHAEARPDLPAFAGKNGGQEPTMHVLVCLSAHGTAARPPRGSLATFASDRIRIEVRGSDRRGAVRTQLITVS